MYLLDITSLELVEPLWRVAEIDEAIYSKMNFMCMLGGILPPVICHFADKGLA